MMTLAKFYLRSGNTIVIQDNKTKIDPVETLKYFEDILKNFIHSTTVNMRGCLGYFRYGGTCISLIDVEAIEISNHLYNEVKSYPDYIKNKDKFEEDKYISYVSSKLPDTMGEYNKYLLHIENNEIKKNEIEK